MTYVLTAIIMIFGVAAFIAVIWVFALAIDENGPWWAFHVVFTVPLIISIVALLAILGLVVQQWLERIL